MSNDGYLAKVINADSPLLNGTFSTWRRPSVSTFGRRLYATMLLCRDTFSRADKKRQKVS